MRVVSDLDLIIIIGGGSYDFNRIRDVVGVRESSLVFVRGIIDGEEVFVVVVGF